MENKCIMDCHNCTLQEGIENKALCASLLMPAMINRLYTQIHRIENAIANRSSVELNEVKLNVEQLNTKENENIENEDLQRTGKS